MATNPSQISKDLTTPSPYVPTRAEVEHRLTQLQSRPPKHVSGGERMPEHVGASLQLGGQDGHDGFEVTMDCPNDRYVNDSAIVEAIAQMWTRRPFRLPAAEMMASCRCVASCEAARRSWYFFESTKPSGSVDTRS